jgi:hypothetical protein
MAISKMILTTGEVELIRAQAARAIAPLKAPETGQKYKWGGVRTHAGRELPEYYLVYFLLVDLLDFPRSGMCEKVAWSIPVEFMGSVATIEHRKMGLGVFSSKTPEDEAIAAEVVAAVTRGIGAAHRYFDHLAAKAVTGSQLNVSNNSSWLLGRYTYLRDLFKQKAASIQNRSLYNYQESETLSEEGKTIKSFSLSYSDGEEAKWIGIAAIEAFFSWTEHVMIHIGILLGKLRTGADVSAMADKEWSEKVKVAIDLSTDKEMKGIYEELLEIRRQVRNYMAHGAFGRST